MLQVRALQRSEDEAASFCSGINQTEAHRCRRAAHLRDWGPDPHWVALVELLLASSASEAVVGAGYPFFKVRATLAQLAPARPHTPPHASTRPSPALTTLTPPHTPFHYLSLQVCNTFTQLAAALADSTPDWLCPLLGEAPGCAPTQRVRLVCASQVRR